MPFVDTHVHLHFPDYQNDLDAVIENAREKGVQHFVNVGTDAESSRASVRLAEKYPFIKATAGIHPNDCAETTAADIQEIAEILKHPKVVAIGEIGLDYYRDHSPKEKQKQVLNAFLDFYQVLGKPLVIHCRDAYDDLALLFSSRGKDWRGVMHCFSSDKTVMKRFLDLGFYISFAGPLTYKKNDVLREACKECPIDRLLLETDAPFLPPQSMRGKRNESGFMIETAETAAGLHGLSLEALGEATSKNARALFGL